jgi:hypothetical protein
MDTLLTILFIGFLIAFFPGSLMIYVFKKSEASLKAMFFLGSFVVFRLDEYVEEKQVPKIKLLLKIGMSFFLLWILVAVLYAL